MAFLYVDLFLWGSKVSLSYFGKTFLQSALPTFPPEVGEPLENGLPKNLGVVSTRGEITSLDSLPLWFFSSCGILSLPSLHGFGFPHTFFPEDLEKLS